MKPVITQLKSRQLYFIPLFVILGLSSVFCLTFSKQESFQLLNFYHQKSLDIFFIKYTVTGDGLISIAGVILLAFSNKRKEALTLLAAYLSSGLAAQLLKHAFDLPRPVLYFKETMVQYQYFIDGVTLHSHSSFPSGHTTSSFAMATVFSLCFNNKHINLPVLLLAVLTGYSRIYLGQHFLLDVVAGAFLGVLFAMFTYYLIWQSPKYHFSNPFNRKKLFLSNKQNIRAATT